eukprot:15460-Prymnesium_polylepis.1
MPLSLAGNGVRWPPPFVLPLYPRTCVARAQPIYSRKRACGGGPPTPRSRADELLPAEVGVKAYCDANLIVIRDPDLMVGT